MLIHSASQVVTPVGGPQRGSALGKLEIISDGAVLVRGPLIEDVGPSAELEQKYPDEPRLSAKGKAVLPGFVDAHTHLVWSGDRAAEFEMRLEGKSYMEIMAAGGGIASTMNATRAVDTFGLLSETRERAAVMFKHGTTTAEAKTGYGLEWKTELAQMKTLLMLDAEGPLEIAPTFMGAHAIPPKFKGSEDGYVKLLCSEMLPALKHWWNGHGVQAPLPFVDIFCEQNAFDLAQTRKILNAAKKLGFPFKVHVDEFENLGAAGLACKLGAVSIEHAVKTSKKEISALGKSNTVVVSLPCTPFGLAQADYTPAKEMLAADVLLAVASDTNPGTAWCENMQFVMALACRYLKLTPAQALAAATINAAYAIQRDERVGSIEPGKQADLLVLSVADYRHLSYRFGTNMVHTVIKKGKVYPND